VSAFPATRLRRLRSSGALRSLVRETRLDLDDFVMPLFVGPTSQANEQLPALGRFTVDDLGAEVEELARLGVGAVILFGIPDEKDELGSGAWDEQGVVQRALRALRPAFPDLLLLTDVCLCEYTSHGHCGILDGEEILNDVTVTHLVQAALSHAVAGADFVAPSDMMDGRVGAIRAKLDAHGFERVPIMAYSAKYASGFYGPFREAAESTPQFGDRRSYQMDPANGREALREVELDIEEGADIVMVKPALSYLDIISQVKQEFNMPVAAYNVSGEFSMVKAAAKLGWIDGDRVMMEILTSIKRAGADMILTYHAKEAAKLLNK
jgi:porphobilinogen synthase